MKKLILAVTLVAASFTAQASWITELSDYKLVDKTIFSVQCADVMEDNGQFVAMGHYNTFVTMFSKEVLSRNIKSEFITSVKKKLYDGKSKAISRLCFSHAAEYKYLR